GLRPPGRAGLARRLGRRGPRRRDDLRASFPDGRLHGDQPRSRAGPTPRPGPHGDGGADAPRPLPPGPAAPAPGAPAPPPPPPPPSRPLALVGARRPPAGRPRPDEVIRASEMALVAPP